MLHDLTVEYSLEYVMTGTYTWVSITGTFMAASLSFLSLAGVILATLEWQQCTLNTKQFRTTKMLSSHANL